MSLLRFRTFVCSNEQRQRISTDDTDKAGYLRLRQIRKRGSYYPFSKVSNGYEDKSVPVKKAFG